MKKNIDLHFLPKLPSEPLKLTTVTCHLKRRQGRVDIVFESFQRVREAKKATNYYYKIFNKLKEFLC